MRVKKITTIVLILLSQNYYSQDLFVNGTTRNSISGEVIPYVNIGIKNRSIGTISNSNGKFKLRLKDGFFNLNDSIIFSCIGFKSRKYTVKNLLNNENVIELKEEYTALEEVVLNTKKAKEKKIGRKVKGLGLMHYNFYSYYDKDIDDRLSKELGMKFNLRKDCEITNLNFNITSNQFKSVKFRINFYRVINNKPIELLFNKDIIFEVKDGYLGWYKVDLKKYDLFIEKGIEDIGITIQWLESKKMNKNSKYFAISASTSPTSRVFFREKAMDKWLVKKSRISFFIDALYYE